MKNRWKKTGAALLIAGLTIGGTGYALADGGKVTEIIDLSQLNEDKVEESRVSPVREIVETDNEETNNVTASITNQEVATTETDKEDGTSGSKKVEATESDKNELPEIPEGYTAGNLAALSKAYEQAGSPTAKAAIKRNMERSIAKWESKQPVVEAPKEEVKETAPVIEETQVAKKAQVQEKKPANVKAKNPQAELNAKQKEQKETLKAAQKAEREALKEKRKAAKELEKQEKHEKKEKKN